MAGEKILVVDDSPTILRVVQLVLSRSGYQVVTAADGEDGLAAARREQPALILLDFVMPKMNGYQMCKALAELPELKETPVVLMSAKGDQLGDRFVQVMRVVDFVTKPFSPEAVTAVVSHALAKYGGGAIEVGDDAILPPDPEALAAATRAESEARRAALEALRGGLAAALGGMDAAALREKLPDARIESLLAELAAASPSFLERGDAALGGDLRAVPIAQVLELLDRQAQSGTLTATRPGAKIDVHFRDGRVELASASGVSEEFLFGRFVVREKMMTREALDEFLRAHASASELLGAQLVRKGLLSEEELRRAIGLQTCELVYELLRWKAGRFVFTATRDLPAVALEAGLGLAIDGILMEGVRRVDEWHLIEKEVENFDLVFLRNEEAVAQLGKGRLTREETAVLDLINGRHSVRDIIRQSRMTSFDVSKMLYRLLSIRLVRKRVMPVAV